VLGYFGRPPLRPAPEVVRIASEQLNLEPFDGDPLEAAPDTLAQAEKALKERGLELTDENIFLVASAIVPGKDMELNGGLRLLQGKAKIVLPLKSKEEAKPAAVAAAPAAAPAAPTPAALTGPVTTTCTVEENGNTRTFRVTVEPSGTGAAPAASGGTAPQATAAPAGTPVYSPFKGKSELVELKVKVGDSVKEGQVVAAVEAMKAKHDVRAPANGKVLSIDAEVGADVMAGQSILTIGQ
jgi:pyruvate carboxylase subunit B